MLLLGNALSHGDDRHRLMALFAPTRRVLSPTYPGQESVGAVVDGLVRLLDVEQLERVDVFGDGLGAGLAQVFARRYPDRVDRVALSGFGLRSRVRVWWNRAVWPLVRMFTDSALRDHVMRPFEKLADGAGPDRAREMLSLVTHMLRRHSRQSLLKRLSLVRDLFCGSESGRLEQVIDRPGRVLLLFANDDPAFSRGEQEALARTWPGANVTRYLTGGHLIGLTKAQELERKLDWFFRVSPVPLTARCG
jgi:pimeloyl-ACP methyl ester carboxylesterase